MRDCVDCGVVIGYDDSADGALCSDCANDMAQESQEDRGVEIARERDEILATMLPDAIRAARRAAWDSFEESIMERLG